MQLESMLTEKEQRIQNLSQDLVKTTVENQRLVFQLEIEKMNRENSVIKETLKRYRSTSDTMESIINGLQSIDVESLKEIERSLSVGLAAVDRDLGPSLSKAIRSAGRQAAKADSEALAKHHRVEHAKMREKLLQNVEDEQSERRVMRATLEFEDEDKDKNKK
jgi:hypothetical protein